MTNLGTEIKTIRKQQKLTLDQLSAASGVNRSTINAYENERYIPNMNTAALLFEALGYEMTLKRIEI